MTGDRCDLMFGASSFGQTPCRRLAQSMRAAMMQAGGVALLAEPIAETGGAERLAVLGDKECEIVVRRVGNDRRQLVVNGNVEHHAGLFLLDVDGVIADVLPSHAHRVAATLAEIEQQRQREPRLGTNRMPALKLIDFGFGPRMKPVLVFA